MIPENAIRERSYVIWLHEGCPEGKSVEHWFRAKAELERDFCSMLTSARTFRGYVFPRLPISRPPQRIFSERIATARISAARQ